MNGLQTDSPQAVFHLPPNQKSAPSVGFAVNHWFSQYCAILKRFCKLLFFKGLQRQKLCLM